MPFLSGVPLVLAGCVEQSRMSNKYWKMQLSEQVTCLTFVICYQHPQKDSCQSSSWHTILNNRFSENSSSDRKTLNLSYPGPSHGCSLFNLFRLEQLLQYTVNGTTRKQQDQTWSIINCVEKQTFFSMIDHLSTMRCQLSGL